ncbi:GNAT family N-acetyltransferase [Microbacterium atlanticum]|uniref:GNAT family N-acetyltransferase n=1 Tax=Microbacterium atlanticum TaxID=2782168 RepID=UPI0018871247|nr:GNAT family N-acetyltransferase [Microbacterium atlanticum]
MTAPLARRVREDEWARVRDLRIRAVSDPNAAMAFLTTPEQELAHDDEFWRARALHASAGDEAAQFIAEVDGEWVGSATVIVRATGTTDHTGRTVYTARADVVGVYVSPEQRGAGTVDALFDAAAAWVAGLGIRRLTLDVHADNSRAQAAYRRNGFAPTGDSFTSSIGPEIVMERVL